MKLIYIVDGRMPTEKANGYQSAQMCQSFSRNGVEVDLIFPKRKAYSIDGIDELTTIEDYYNLKTELKKTKLPCVDFIHVIQVRMGFSDSNFFSKMASVLTSYSLALSVVWYLRKKTSR